MGRRTAVLATGMLVTAGLVDAGCAHTAPRFDPGRRPTCLVLSAGGTRGVAHLGAVAAVREAGIPVSCVVGASVGALVGGLYASAPEQDTTERFRRLTRSYLAATEQEANTRGVETGLIGAAIAAALSGGLLAPAGAAVGGFLLGTATTPRADRARLEGVLRNELGAARIEGLPIAFASLHQVRDGQGLAVVVDRAGDLAEAVGASIANPYIFEDVDVVQAPKLDPGADRVAATPVQDACRAFPEANLLVINLQRAPAIYDAHMTCPLREVMVTVDEVPPEALFRAQPAFDTAWNAGHAAVRQMLAVGRPSAQVSAPASAP